MVGHTQQRSVSYDSCFRAVYRKRLRYVNRICLLLAMALSVLLRLPYGSFWWNVVDSGYRVPVVFMALWLVKQGRSRNSSVDYSRAKTLAQQLVHSILSRRFISTFGFFLASSCLIYLVFLIQLPLLTNYSVLSKEYRRRPAVNDEWVYFWFHAAFVAFCYALQHVVFQRNRLQFQYGISKIRPEKVLFTRLHILLGPSVFFCVFCSIATPIVYCIVRGLIYKLWWIVFVVLSLDTATPPFHVGLGTIGNLAFVSLLTFCAWEFVNHSFNIYATIGCLDGKTPISSQTTDPVATLLTGLRDVDSANALSHLTSFQELAYISSSSDAFCVSARNTIFNTQGGNYWASILAECSLIIRDTSTRVNHRSKTDLDAIRNYDSGSRTDASTPSSAAQPQKENLIFGNSHDVTSNDTTQFAVSATSSPLQKRSTVEMNENVMNAPKSSLASFIKKSKCIETAASNAWQTMERCVITFLKIKTTKPVSFKCQLDAVIAMWNKWYSRFLGTSAGSLFRTTLKRDTESRVINPVNFGNAVLALSGLLMHAVEEDRSGTVSNAQISEVLNLLERPIRSCANYTDLIPASVYLSPFRSPNGQEQKHHIIALMHDLTMNEFFQLCVKYNYKLNDLSLSPRAFKLAKWVIDASIASQQKRSQHQIETLL